MSLPERIYNNNMNVVRMIDDYEILKDAIINDYKDPRFDDNGQYMDRQDKFERGSFYWNLALFLDQYQKEKRRCRRVCWADFITNYLFVLEKVPIASSKYIYNIYPNVDLRTNIMNPKYTLTFENLPSNFGSLKDRFNIRYDFRTKLVYSNFYNILMLDYDIKDGISREEAIEELRTIIEVGARAGLRFTFAVMPTDRGLHAFLLSQQAYRNIFWVDLMRLACTDPYYTAFSYASGFGIRLSKKEKTPDDLVGWLTPLNLPVNPEEQPDDDKNPDVELSELIDIGYPTREFFSAYLNRSITVKIFGENVRYPGDPNDKLQYIGDPANVMGTSYDELQLQYLLLQYFRSFSVQQIADIECEIYNAAIFPYQSRIGILQQDIDALIDIITPLKSQQSRYPSSGSSVSSGPSRSYAPPRGSGRSRASTRGSNQSYNRGYNRGSGSFNRY